MKKITQNDSLSDRCSKTRVNGISFGENMCYELFHWMCLQESTSRWLNSTKVVWIPRIPLTKNLPLVEFNTPFQKYMLVNFFKGSLQFNIWKYLLEIRLSERLLGEQHDAWWFNPKAYPHVGLSFPSNLSVTVKGFFHRADFSTPKKTSPKRSPFELPAVPGVFRTKVFHFGPFFILAKRWTFTAQSWTFTAYPAFFRNNPPNYCWRKKSCPIWNVEIPLNKGYLSTVIFPKIRITIQKTCLNPPQKCDFYPNHKIDSWNKSKLSNFARRTWGICFTSGIFDLFEVVGKIQDISHMVVLWWFTMVESKTIPLNKHKVSVSAKKTVENLMDSIKFIPSNLCTKKGVL